MNHIAPLGIKILRPRPQVVFHLAAIVFNSFFLIHILLVLTNSYSNTILAEIGQDLPRELGTGLALIYPFMYSIPNDRGSKAQMLASEDGAQLRKSSNKSLIDLTGFFVMIAPIATMLPLACLTGYYADHELIADALQLSMIHSFIWAIWVALFLGSSIFFWCKLIFIIWNNIDELERKRKNEGSNVQSEIATLKKAARNDSKSLKHHSSKNSKFDFHSTKRLDASKDDQVSIVEFDEESTMPASPTSPISLEKKKLNDRPSAELRTSVQSNDISESRRDSCVSDSSSRLSDGTIRVNQDSGGDNFANSSNAIDSSVCDSTRIISSSSWSNSRFYPRGSKQTSISTLSDLSLSPTSSISDEVGMTIYPSSLTPRSNYFFNTNLTRSQTLPLHRHKSHESSMGQIAEEMLGNNKNDIDIFSSDTINNNLIRSNVNNGEGYNDYSITSDDVIASTRASRAKSEEDLTLRGDRSNRVGGSHRSAELYQQGESVSMVSIPNMQDWLKRPVSTIPRKKTISQLNNKQI
ncbi:2855_t:CDS:2 [Acaulospora colombiana]|uniref:2855_t:CDS:1 n=1 Tax=Acaulospora colombiana TaxID=27376 RepID=A0ACA9KC43_9GLOM|nr:2855_t:CDS:2 [Acaulospora colombiana]